MKLNRLLVLLTFLVLLAACNGTPPAANTPAPQSSPTPEASPTAPLTGFAKDLQYVRNGGYTYIWVFSRKDGKPLDREDGAFLRTNAPQVVDWITTEEGKKVIGGTNFNLEEGNLGLIKKRLVTEDYSAR